MSPPKLILKPPPGRDFLQGYPGIPASATRPAAHLSGMIEVQMPSAGAEVAWVRVEMAKIETIPGGGTWQELIGQGPLDVWKPADGAGWEQMASRALPFKVPIPEKLPPSLALDKHGGIRYQLVATMKVRTKKGFLRKGLHDVAVRDTREITLEKHEWHSLWPIYRAPEEYAQAQGPFEVKVFRNQKAFAPADVVDVRVIVNSQAPKRVKLKSITVMIRQITVFKTPQRAPDRRLEILATKTKSLRKKLATNEFFLQDMALTLPKKSTVMSVHTAKHIQITHDVRVVAHIEQAKIEVTGLDMIVSGFSSAASSAALPRIGAVPELDRMPDAEPTPAPPAASVFVDSMSTAPADVMPPAPAVQDAAPATPDAWGAPPTAPSWPTPTTAMAPAMPFMSMRPGDVVPNAASQRASYIDGHGASRPNTSGSAAAAAAAAPPASLQVSSQLPARWSMQTPDALFLPTRHDDAPPSWEAPPAAASSSSYAAPAPAYPSAAEEKAALQRNDRAQSMQPVSSTQPAYAAEPVYDAQPAYVGQPTYDAPSAYDAQPAYDAPSAYTQPAHDYGGPGYDAQPAYGYDAPPHAPAPYGHDDEKAQAQRYYEAQAAVARHQEAQSAAADDEASSSVVSPSFLTRSEARAMEEKAKLQSHYAQLEQDAAAHTGMTLAPFASTHSSSTATHSSSAAPPRPPKVRPPGY